MESTSEATKKDTAKCDGCIKIINIIKEDDPILCCKYTDDCKTIALGMADGKLVLYNICNAKHITNLMSNDTKGSALTCITHRSLGKKNKEFSNCLICSYTNGLVKCWNVDSQKCEYTITEDRQIFGVEYHPTLTKFITYGTDGKINLYNEETLTNEQSFFPSSRSMLDGHVTRIFSTNFHPSNNNEFISGGWDKVVYIWDLRKSHASRHISSINVCGDGVKISPNGQNILTCSYDSDDSLNVWDYNTLKKNSQINPDVYKSKAYCGQYINVNYAVIGGSEINLLRIIDMKRYLTVGYMKNLNAAIYGIDVGLMENKSRARLKAALEDFKGNSNIICCSGNNLYELTYTKDK